MVRFTSKLTLILGLCTALALAKVANKAAVDNRPEVICNNGNCYSRIFRPTTEFQEVLEGQEIPIGLHVQMDFETHRKYAKLMDPEEIQNKDATNSILIVDTDKPGTFQHNVGSEDNLDSLSPPPLNVQLKDDQENDHSELEEASRLNLQTAFDSIPELAHLRDPHQEDTQNTEPPAPRQTNHEIFAKQLDLVKTSDDNGVVLNALEELLDLASDMEFGLLLSKGDALKALTNLLDFKGHGQVRSKTALVIGIAIQNHEEASKAGFKANLHKTLLNRLQLETDETTLRRLIFAYGNLVRGGGANSGIIQDNDVSRLADVYNKSSDEVFKRRCVYIMSDFADPDYQRQSESTEEESESGKAEVEKSALDVGPWCNSLQKENQTKEDSEKHEDWEVIDRAVELLHASYPETCILTDTKVRDEL
ncbi:hypothetical protein BG011_006951 [Mortierella polycephala]|uniref:Nucleotide exchange factor SIL1 n=1 Tax=Mortierella polycephala TaxID=41804 RepID=A0A9P6PUP5_9FUNG|nr:hypothetical protein BG011_006951 [Mortierella polycephala]